MSELQDLVDSLAAMIDRSVAIDDQRFRLMVFSSHTQDIDDVRQASILHRQAPHEVSERLTALGVQNALGPIRIQAIPELGMRPRVCIAIRFDRFLLGYMWLIEDRTRLSDDDLCACVEVARDAAPLMYRQRIFDDRAHERELRCVADLLDIASETRGACARVALEEGIILAASSYGVIAVDSAKPMNGHGEERTVTVLAALARVRRALRPHDCIVGHVGSRGVLIAALPERELSRVGRRVYAELCASGGERDVWRIGQGAPVRDLAAVILSYETAVDAMRIATAVSEASDIAAWGKLGAWKFLCRIPDDDRTRIAFHPGIATLARLRDGRMLLGTLEAYLDHAGDAHATATQLYIHRTTLYARLRRIEREADVNLSSGEDRLSLHISLRLWRVMSGDSEVTGSSGSAPPAKPANRTTSAAPER